MNCLTPSILGNRSHTIVSFELLSTQKRWRPWCKVEQHCLRSTAASLWLHSVYPLHLYLGAPNIEIVPLPINCPLLLEKARSRRIADPPGLPSSSDAGERDERSTPILVMYELSNYPAMAFSNVVHSAHLCNLYESILIADFATLPRIFIYCALNILHYCTLSGVFGCRGAKRRVQGEARL